MSDIVNRCDMCFSTATSNISAVRKYMKESIMKNDDINVTYEKFDDDQCYHLRIITYTIDALEKTVGDVTSKFPDAVIDFVQVAIEVNKRK